MERPNARGVSLDGLNKGRRSEVVNQDVACFGTNSDLQGNQQNENRDVKGNANMAVTR